MKREDLAGPSAISGSKTRLAEFILGRAIEARQAELEAQGHKVLVVGTGGAHPDGFVAHA